MFVHKLEVNGKKQFHPTEVEVENGDIGRKYSSAPLILTPIVMSCSLYFPHQQRKGDGTQKPLNLRPHLTINADLFGIFARF